MPRVVSILIGVLLTATGLMFAMGANAAQVTLQPVKDATLIGDESALANGKGPIFIGKIAGGSARRSLMQFDFAGIPAGSTIRSVQLKVWVFTAASNSSFDDIASLYRLTTSWGEGQSFASGGNGGAAQANDSTWVHRFYPNQFWSAAGGDFVSQPSSSTLINTLGEFTFPSTPALVADVQQWVNAPATNFGWLMKDVEHPDVDKNAKRLFSRESGTFGPQLTIVYDLPGANTGDSDVPLPAWALALLGAALISGLSGRSLRKTRG
jgi:hypothetical protein